MEILSRALLSLKSESVLVSDWQMKAPWGVDNADFPHAFCLCVMSGECVFKPQNQDAFVLKAGDSVLSTRGEKCAYSSAPKLPLSSLAEIWQQPHFLGFSHFSPTEIYNIQWGGNGAETRFIVLAFDFDSSVKKSILDSLPSFISVQKDNSAMVASLHRNIELLIAEAGAQISGYFALSSRLAELVFISLLRIYILNHAQSLQGWLKGLSDPRIAKALACMHETPSLTWSVSQLAAKAGMSRTRFFAKFSQLVGMTPMNYLNECRIQLACQLLRETSHSICELSEKTGFQSERAFRRTFRQKIQQSPTGYRKSILERN